LITNVRLRAPAWRSVALFVAGVLLGIPAVAFADHQFPDVPTANLFHDQIAAIAEAGITAGFPDGGYHPGDAVTRQAMAAFMQRGFGRVALAVNTAPMTDALPVLANAEGAPYVAIRQLTITVPGTSNPYGPTQLVHVQGRVLFISPMDNVTRGCPCEFIARIRDTTSGAFSGEQYQTFDGPSPNAHAYSFDVEGLFAAPPGPRTYQLEVGLNYRDRTTANAVSFTVTSGTSLSAMTFPFGPTGTSDL
jgi:hypothetical protein